MRKSLALLCLLVVFGGLMTSGLVSAQVEEYKGYMGDDVPNDEFPIYLEEGQVLEVTAVADNSQLDPYLFLYDPDGYLVMENDDRDINSFNAFFRYIAPAAGEYKIVLSSIAGTNGAYRLTAEVISGVSADPLPIFERGPGVYTGFMGDLVSNNFYRVFVNEGQVLTATAEADSSNLDTYLLLRDPQGDIVLENDDWDDTTLNSYFTYTATTTGEYTIIMSNFAGTDGNYILTIELSGEDGGPTREFSGEETVYTGYMGDDVNDDSYSVYLNAGQMIRIIAEADNSDLDTYLILLGMKGDRVAENDDLDFSTRNSYIEYIAKLEGEYTVILSNYPETSGDYRLIIEIGDPAAVRGEGSQNEASAPPPEGAEVHTGFMADDVPDDRYSFELVAGQGVVVTAETTTGDLDPYLFLFDAAENEVARNDDRNSATLDSEMVFVAEESGTFTAVVSNIRETSGDYRLTISVMAGDAIELPSRVEMSGAILFQDTEHFRIHYTLEGDDAVTEEYLSQVVQTMEEVYEIQTNQLGWPVPPSDGSMGGDGRYDVYLVNLLDHHGGGDLGWASPEWPTLDNPHTAATEEYAVASYLALDNDYTEEDVIEGKDSISLMRATAAHEFHHGIQFGYDLGDQFGWYYEATASWMETVTFPAQQDAAGYVESPFTYPEVCFGVEGEADPTGGLLMYGSWLFLDSLASAHGDKAPMRLWENIALYEGWDSLEETLREFGDTLPQALARYHAQNLVRDYQMTPAFSEYTVWLENSINSTGDWTFNGQGIQELGANYYEVNLQPGQYAISVHSSEASIELWAIMISGTTAEVMALGAGATLDTSGYDNVYLMAFNPDYDDDVTDCRYVDYTISVDTGVGTMPGAVFKFNANHFEPPSQ